MPTVTMEPKSKGAKARGAVYCPMCTHTVEAMIVFDPRNLRVAPGQRCPRCSASLDAGYVMRADRAA
jgi:uncharacterized protein (UPF0212 family)